MPVVYLSTTDETGTHYIAHLTDRTADGKGACEWQLSDDPEQASVMTPSAAVMRLQSIRRTLGHDAVIIHGENGKPVRICFECRNVTPESDMLPHSDLCRDCASEIDHNLEWSLPDLDGF